MKHADLLGFRCPFCGSEEVRAGKIVHCSNVACALNRVDVPEEQWSSRPLEEDLVLEHDNLRGLVNRQTQTVMGLGEQIRRMQEREKRERQERKEKWLRRVTAERLQRHAPY